MKIEQPSQKALKDWAYQATKDLILENKLLPGHEISINALAEILNTSQTPVREAVVRLSSEGLIEHRAHKNYEWLKLLKSPKVYRY